MEARDFNDPKYKQWRQKVYGRDGFKCKMPGCTGADKRLNAHHIRKWASYPALRYVVSNGATLCRTCHEKIRGREEEYEGILTSAVCPETTNAQVRLLMMRYGAK